VWDRRLVVMYVSAIPLLYTLWFFGFWALLVVAEAANLGLSGAAVYAALFGIASAIGYPLGGRMFDVARSKGVSTASLYFAVCAIVALLVVMVAWVTWGETTSLVLLALLMFAVGVLFSAAQTVNMALTGLLAPSGKVGQTFGMWNLVAETGAVVSPVLSGAIRDATGGWGWAILLDAVLLGFSALLVLTLSVHRPAA
jgi:MFS family permease